MKPPTVVIVLQGGQLSQVLADEPVNAILVDYDIEGTTDGIVQVHQSGGGTEPAVGGEQEVQVDRAAVAWIRKSFGLPIHEDPIKLLSLIDTLVQELKECKTPADQDFPYVALRNTVRSLLCLAMEPEESEVTAAVKAILTSRNVVLL